MDAPSNPEIERLRSLYKSERDPDGRVFATLADAHRRAGHLDRALELVDEGRTEHPDFATGHVVAALVHRDRDEPEGAEDAYRRVLELDPENAVALRGLAGLLRDRGEDAEAETLLSRLAELGLSSGDDEPEEESSDDEAPDATGRDDATVDADSSRAEAPDDEGDEGPVTRTMAEIYARQGLHDRAARIYERLLERDPDDAEVRGRLEELRERAGDEARSDEQMETVAREMSEGGGTEEVESPFSWDRHEEVPAAAGGVAEPPVAAYFEQLLAWEPEEEVPEQETPEETLELAEAGPETPSGSDTDTGRGEIGPALEEVGGAEPSDEDVRPPSEEVEAEAAARPTVDVGGLSPDAVEGAEAEASAMEIGGLAPDAEPEPAPMEIGGLAPDEPESEPVPMEMGALAPDGAAGVPTPEVDTEPHEGAAEIDIGGLAPEEEPDRDVVGIGGLAPETEAVEPEPEALDIGGLAPDGGSAEAAEPPTVDIGGLSPDAVEGAEAEASAMDIGGLAPDAEPEPAPMEIGGLAPDEPEPEPLDIGALAPEGDDEHGERDS